MKEGQVTLRKLVLITFFSSLYFYIHVNTLYLSSRGLSLMQIASLESIITVTVFLAEIPTGIIADRIGRKWSVVLALACQAAGEFFYIFARSYSAFVFIALLAGIGFAFLSGAGEALLYDEIPEAEKDTLMQKAMGRLGSAYQFGFFLSPLIGGVIVSRFALSRYMIVIAMTACSVTIALIISFTLHETRRPTVERQSAAGGQAGMGRSSSTGRQPSESVMLIKEGFSLIKSNTTLRQIVAITVFTATFGDIALMLYQPLFKQNGFSPFLIGAALAGASLLSAVTQRYAYKLEKWFGPKTTLTLAAVLPGVFFVAWGLAGAPWSVFSLFILTYGFRELKKPLLASYQNREIHSYNRATVISIINMGLSMYVAVSRVILGRIAELSIGTALISGGIVIILFTCLTRPWGLFGKE